MDSDEPKSIPYWLGYWTGFLARLSWDVILPVIGLWVVLRWAFGS